MLTVATYTVPAEDFPLGRLFTDVPDASVELDRVVPTGDETLPYFWIAADDLDEVAAAIRTSQAAESLALVAETEDRGLFRIEWDTEASGVVDAIAEAGLTLLSGVGSSDEWLFEFRDVDSEGLTAFQRYCGEHGIDATLVQTRPHEDGFERERRPVTDEQYEALVLAYEEGYFDPQSGTTLDDLADELGISYQSVSGRLRRGYRNLVEQLLTESSQSSERGTE